MRQELSLTANYVTNWGMYEGIRELIQNAKDGETEYNAKMDIKLHSSGTLSIQNKGTTLPRESLLIGYSSKSGDTSTIGQFGEGLKLGTLALVRNGYNIKIKNGPELWTPIIVQSKVYNHEVLAFDITKRKTKSHQNDLIVEVQGIGQENWARLKKKFLFLQKGINKITTSYIGNKDEILLDKELKGDLYVKGIYIQNKSDLDFGYNLHNVDVDRDRRMVNSFDLRYETSRTLMQAFKEAGKEMSKKIFNVLMSSSDEASLITSWVNEDTRQKMYDLFKAEYGETAFPIETFELSRDISYIGYKPVMASNAFCSCLEPLTGRPYTLIEKDKRKNLKQYTWTELTTAEQENITKAIKLLRDVTTLDSKNLKIVDFEKDNQEGMFEKGTIYINRNCLLDLKTTIHVLVHEYAHNYGPDFTAEHNQAMGDIFSEIISKLQ